jgi:hypothetical protein
MQCEIPGLFTALDLSMFVASWALGGLAGELDLSWTGEMEQSKGFG